MEWFNIPSDPSLFGPDDRNLEPFYTEALPCESCGKPCDSRKPATWDPDLQVGKCCEVAVPDDAELEQPVCIALYEAVMHCRFVSEVSAVFDLHARECALCNPQRIGVEVESPIRQERAA
jgi:hypothetical protein